MTASYHYEVKGLDEMIDALEAVSKPPTFRVTGKLETVLQQSFLVTQENVHIISGRLKASGHTESDFDGKKWSGQINYGGPKGTPAYYGIYELNRPGVKPGLGPHDFFFGLEAFDAEWEKAVDTHFDPLTGP